MTGNEMLWHTMETETVIAQLSTSSSTGLTEEESRTRLEQHGPNELIEGQGVSPYKIFFEQFKNILIIILLVAVGLSVIWSSNNTIKSNNFVNNDLKFRSGDGSVNIWDDGIIVLSTSKPSWIIWSTRPFSALTDLEPLDLRP